MFIRKKCFKQRNRCSDGDNRLFPVVQLSLILWCFSNFFSFFMKMLLGPKDLWEDDHFTAGGMKIDKNLRFT